MYIWRQGFTHRLAIAGISVSCIYAQLYDSVGGLIVMMLMQVTQFSDFLRDALAADPLRRSTASELLQHKWLQDTC
jgi:hypothetical protein